MNGYTIAELTRRIDPFQPQRVPPKRRRRGKIYEWLKTAEEWLNTVIDYLPAIAAIATFFLMIAVAATPK